MVVLLVYPASKQPVSVIAHGYNGQTWFSVVDTPNSGLTQTWKCSSSAC
jgi:hypothetical protein